MDGQMDRQTDGRTDRQTAGDTKILHSLFYKFINENGAKITIFANFEGFTTLLEQ